MRIKVVRPPTQANIDGVQLDRFVRGRQYEVSNLLGAVFLAEGWAEPVESERPTVLTPYSAFEEDRAVSKPSNLVREIFPPDAEMPRALAADRRRRPRRPK
jgi:hypothetical protein